eukprot:9090490-Pyramimonas_sp.AAC.1
MAKARASAPAIRAAGVGAPLDLAPRAFAWRSRRWARSSSWPSWVALRRWRARVWSSARPSCCSSATES